MREGEALVKTSGVKIFQFCTVASVHKCKGGVLKHNSSEVARAKSGGSESLRMQPVHERDVVKNGDPHHCAEISDLSGIEVCIERADEICFAGNGGS